MMPDYDSRLEWKRRRRDQEEINGIVKDQYRDYLREKVGAGFVWYLLSQLSEKDQRQVLDDLIEQVVEVKECGYADKEFSQRIDWPAITWEER